MVLLEIPRLFSWLRGKDEKYALLRCPKKSSRSRWRARFFRPLPLLFPPFIVHRTRSETSPTGTLGRCFRYILDKYKKTQHPDGRYVFFWLRGKDLNQRPSGYEPDELPTAPPRDISLVPLTGLEPVRYFYRRILSPLCLPIPPQRQVSSDAHSLECHNRIPHIVNFVNIFFEK